LPIVSLQRCADYEVSRLVRTADAAVRDLGGWGRFVSRGDRVLVKPNLISAAGPDRPVQTHPAVVEAICRILLDLGVKPYVGDSPAWGSLEGNARKSGLAERLAGLGVPLVPFNRPVKVRNERGRIFEHLTVDRSVLEADVVINVPKLKTHQQLVLTAAIKNLFGCMPGKRKAWWHFKAGSYDNYFALMLVEMCRLVGPALTIIDAVVAMEGPGPISGAPRYVGLLLGGEDPASLERVCCELLSADPARLAILRACAQVGYGELDLRRMHLMGAPLDEHKIDDFAWPEPVPIAFSLPRVVRSLIKQLRVLRRQRREAAQAS